MSAPDATGARPAAAAVAATPRERLLQAAREVVAVDGLEGLTLRAIARRAGVSHGAPLRHFPSLASLLAAVGADGFGRLIDTVNGHLATADRAAAEAGHTLGPHRRLAVAGQAYLHFALADPGVFSVTFRPERVDVTDPEYQSQGAAAFQQLVDLVEAVQADGWQADRPSDAVAAVVWAQVHGLAVLALHGALGAVVADPGPIDRDSPDRRDGTDGPDVADGPDGGLAGRLAALAARMWVGDDPDLPPSAADPRRPTRHPTTDTEKTT